jgi:hypothetical protein
VARRHLLAFACAVGATLGAAVGVARADPMPPEDPVAGSKSTAQWRQHLADEERERQLQFDGQRLKQHRAVLKLLTAARARYDRARSKAAVLSAQKRLPPVVEEAQRRIKQIDRWGNNSRLLVDYDTYLKALSTHYPAARIAMLEGHRAALDTIRGQLDEVTKRIQSWLAEAAHPTDD